MKLLNFRSIFLCSLLLVVVSISSQNISTSYTDSLSYISSDTNRYHRHLRRYRNTWESLIPTHIKIQYAGGMGLISTGIGWDYGKNSQWETDLLLGFIPRYSSDHFKMTFTIKQNYIPWSVGLNKHFWLEPLECGLYFNTVLSNKFWTKEPDRYPNGYYGFSTRIRTHIFLGQRLRIDIPEKSRISSKSVTLFYEISTCDFYVISAVNNSYLKPDDYLRLSFGAKFQIF